MSFISAFDVMGPNMIGPSSSHTAGAARIAFLARKMLNSTLKKSSVYTLWIFCKNLSWTRNGSCLIRWDHGIWNRRYENPRFFRDCKRHWT